ncbi:MAG TPA: hypothetical protein VE715_12610 [Blastocatellia bacterium]|nr:hypothetical protein [Blastocatellia bacterium]
MRAAILIAFGIRDRYPQLPDRTVKLKLEIRRHHANHRMIFAVNSDGFADDVRIGVVPIAPQGIADHDHLMFAGLFLFGQKRASQTRFDAEHVKKVRGNTHAGNALRYRPGLPVEIMDNPAQIAGDPLLKGFVLKLEGILD